MSVYAIAALLALALSSEEADGATAGVSIEQACPAILDVTEEGPINSRAKSTVPPRYPVAMLTAGKSGTVTMLVLIGTDGSVINVEVLKTTHPSFNREAVNALKQWRWPEAVHDGKPTCVRGIVEIQFKLL